MARARGARSRVRALASTFALTLALTLAACTPPRASTGRPGAPAVSRADALARGREALRARCWPDATWRVVWWAERDSWAVWCTMANEEAYAECSARIDAGSGEVTISRLCTSTSWD